MPRDHRKLKVFQAADALVEEVYRCTHQAFPPEERFGLLTQIRRAAVSVPSNIVEGCARRTTKDYLSFINQALASASEAAYLLELSSRLGFLDKAPTAELVDRYQGLIRGLHKLIAALQDQPEARSL